MLPGVFLLSLVSLVCGDSVYSGESRGTCPLSTAVLYIDWKGFGLALKITTSLALLNLRIQEGFTSQEQQKLFKILTNTHN